MKKKIYIALLLFVQVFSIATMGVINNVVNTVEDVVEDVVETIVELVDKNTISINILEENNFYVVNVPTIQWDVRMMTPDAIFRWYRCPGNHVSGRLNCLYDSSCFLVLWMFDAEGNYAPCYEGTAESYEQIPATNTEDMRLDMVWLDAINPNASLYNIEDEREMYSLQQISFSVPTAGDTGELLSKKVRCLTVDDICSWYRLGGNHPSALNATLASVGSLGCWVYNFEAEAYEFVVEGTQRAAEQIADAEAATLAGYPIKIDFVV